MPRLSSDIRAFQNGGVVLPPTLSTGFDFSKGQMEVDSRSLQ